VGPEEEQDDVAFQIVQHGHGRSEVLARVERRRYLPFECQQVEVLLQPLVNRAVPVFLNLPFEEVHGRRPVAACGAHERIGFDGGTKRGPYVRVGLEPPRLEGRHRQVVRVNRILHGLIEIAGGICAARKP
jgi:hypothetical protein